MLCWQDLVKTSVIKWYGNSHDIQPVFKKVESLFLLTGRKHCVKSLRIRSYSGLYFPVFSTDAGKCGPE